MTGFALLWLQWDAAVKGAPGTMPASTAPATPAAAPAAAKVMTVGGECCDRTSGVSNSCGACTTVSILMLSYALRLVVSTLNCGVAGLKRLFGAAPVKAHCGDQVPSALLK